MTTKKILMTPENAYVLIERLRNISSVKKFDQPGESQAETLVHALTDIEESFRTYLQDLLPQLLERPGDEEHLNKTLLDIGEEFRHVLYHFRDVNFFGYLLEVEKPH
jgi:hypothetical protein